MASKTLSIEGLEPYVQTPMWVVLHPALSPTARLLYGVLAAHANPEEETVWPGREHLAAILGLRRPQSVDPYLRELTAVGVITVERRKLGGLRVRNHYRLRWTAPEDHTGPRSLAESRRLLREDLDA